MSKILVKILQGRYILYNSARLPIQLQDYRTSLIGFHLGQVLMNYEQNLDFAKLSGVKYVAKI